jgi:hypothetical protein
MQVPAHAWLQQTMSTQWPLMQSVPIVQAVPFIANVVMHVLF